MKFKVGNKIRMVKAEDAAEVGMIGTIRGYKEITGNYCVFFEDMLVEHSGHTCDGMITEGGGHYVSENCMELCEETQKEQLVSSVPSSSSPIMRFESQQQLDESLAEWQSRLLLSDWIIMAKLVKPEELERDGKQLGGFNSHVDTLMSSEISIADGEFPNSVTKVCAEESLVHELLHLKLPMFIVDGSIESCVYNDGVHATIEQLAKSLLMAKYNLSLSWFKNF